jgi:hypothetical protein
MISPRPLNHQKKNTTRNPHLGQDENHIAAENERSSRRREGEIKHTPFPTADSRDQISATKGRRNGPEITKQTGEIASLPP